MKQTGPDDLCNDCREGNKGNLWPVLINLPFDENKPQLVCRSGGELINHLNKLKADGHHYVEVFLATEQDLEKIMEMPFDEFAEKYAQPKPVILDCLNEAIKKTEEDHRIRILCIEQSRGKTRFVPKPLTLHPPGE